ncbi:hypothetical protein, partial [Planotetraspora phitsanulokensis]
MPDQWQVTDVTETTDNSGQIEAWEMRITRDSDDTSIVLWLPKTAIESAAVAYGLTSTDEAIDVLLHQTVLPVYDQAAEVNPWTVSGEQARAAVMERVGRCRRDHATVETAAPAKSSARRGVVD